MLQYNKSIAHSITYHLARRMDLFRMLSLPEQAAIFEHLSPYVRKNIIENLKEEELVDLLDQMDMQDAENALALLKNANYVKKIVKRVKNELKEKVEYFLRFHPKAAMSLLNFNYLLLGGDTVISGAANAIEEHYREVGKLPEILVHENGILVGEVPLSALVRESNNNKIKKYVVPVKTVNYQAEVNDIVSSFSSTKHGKVAVLDKDGSVMGIIYSDDALALFDDQPATSLYDFAGVDDTERSFDSAGSKFKHRYKWLIMNLVTAFLAASVVGIFKDTLSQLVLLAVYMPIIAGMGGNAATQTLAVIVRGIAMGEIDLKSGKSAILKEVGAGFLNGVLNGAIVAIVVTLWNGNPMLGLVLAVAMIINLVIAGFFGSLIPLVMKAMGKDPATSATIFITTATDVFGFFVFLGLATLVLF